MGITKWLDTGAVSVKRAGAQVGIQELEGMGIADLVGCKILMDGVDVRVECAEPRVYGNQAIHTSVSYTGQETTVKLTGVYETADALAFLLDVYTDGKLIQLKK